MVLIARTVALAFSRPTILSSSLHRGLRPVITSTTKDATDSIEFVAFFSCHGRWFYWKTFLFFGRLCFFLFFFLKNAFTSLLPTTRLLWIEDGKIVNLCEFIFLLLIIYHITSYDGIYINCHGFSIVILFFN